MSISEPRNTNTSKKKENIDDYEVILSSTEPESGTKEEIKTESEIPKLDPTENHDVVVVVHESSGLRDSIKDKLNEKANLKRVSTENQSLLEYLFSFLDTQEALNPVLSGYFHKLVQVLFNRNSAKVNLLRFWYK